MIECKSCGLPTLPIVLFWEAMGHAKAPCFCGSVARTRRADAVPAMTDDLYAQDRATNEGMAVPEVILAARRHQVAADAYAEARASDDGMAEPGRRANTRAAARSYRDIVEEAGEAALPRNRYKTVSEIMAAKRQREADAKFTHWIAAHESRQRHADAGVVRNGIVLKYVFKAPAEESAGRY